MNQPSSKVKRTRQDEGPIITVHRVIELGSVYPGDSEVPMTVAAFTMIAEAIAHDGPDSIPGEYRFEFGGVTHTVTTEVTAR